MANKMFFVISIFIGLFLRLPVCRAGDPCPPAETLKFCICRMENAAISGELPYTSREGKSGNSSESNATLFFTIVTCNKSKSIQELEEDVSSGLYRKEIDKLKLREIPEDKTRILATLPAGFLRHTRVKHIEISDSKLSGSFLWKDYPFEGQETSLTMLTLRHCSLHGALTYDTPGSVNTRNIESLPSLEMLDLSMNYLTFVHSTAFRKVYRNLSHIDLSFNAIEAIEANAFASVLNLKSISLGHNALRYVHRSVFHTSSMRLLDTIDLSWNFLSSLPHDLFSNMPALKVVVLAQNFLHSLPEKPWSQVWSQLSYLDLGGNFINCNCELLWIVLHRSGVASAASGEKSPRFINGTCDYHKLPTDMSLRYPLRTLKRDELMCQEK